MWKDKGRATEYNRAYYIANGEKIRAQAREHGKSSKAVARRIAYAAENPLVGKKAKKAWWDRNPEKRKAQGALRDAVRHGKIVKPKACSKCDKEGRIEGHHPDYSKRLEVIWLCRRCHVFEHKTVTP